MTIQPLSPETEQTLDDPHVPAAFINAIAEEGTKAEAIEWLQKQWNENCALRAELKALRRPAQTEREMALERAAYEFCDKVHRGEARSVKSYAAFKAALALPSTIPAQCARIPKPPDALNDADMKLATDWYTWGFQSGMDAAREVSALTSTQAPAQRAPTTFYLAQLRHAYAQLAAGTVKNQKQFADGLIAPAIRDLEQYALTSTDSDSPVMGAARRAAKVVEGWSDSKRDYADRVTSTKCDAPCARDAEIKRLRKALESVCDYSNDPQVGHMAREALSLTSTARAQGVCARCQGSGHEPDGSGQCFRCYGVGKDPAHTRPSGDGK